MNIAWERDGTGGWVGLVHGRHLYRIWKQGISWYVGFWHGDTHRSFDSDLNRGRYESRTDRLLKGVAEDHFVEHVLPGLLRYLDGTRYLNGKKKSLALVVCE